MQQYIALRAFRLPNGSPIAIGEVVPGAANWRNPRVWVDFRYMRLAEPGEVEPEPEPTAPAPPAPPAETPAEPPAPPPAAPDGADPLEALAAVLAEVIEGSDHSKAEMIALAEAAGVDIPESVPRARVDLAEILADNAGFAPQE